MNHIHRLYEWLYTQLLKLYPSDFYADFGDEMQQVFTQAIAEHPVPGKARRFFLKELGELPANLLHQYRLASKKEILVMGTAFVANEQAQATPELRQPGTWAAAIIAGLPHLLICLLIGIGKMSGMDTYQGVHTASIIGGVGLALLVIGVMLFAWRKRWPIWSASWYFYVTWLAMIIVGLTVEQLQLDESWRYTNLLLLAWIAFCIIGYAATLIISKMHGLLAVFFLLPFLGIANMEFIPDPIEGWLIIGIGLLAFLTAGSIVRIGDWRAALGLTLAFNLITGTGLAYVTVYQATDIPAIYLSTPSFGEFIVSISLYGLIMAGILSLPFLLQGLWEFGRKKFSA